MRRVTAALVFAIALGPHTALAQSPVPSGVPPVSPSPAASAPPAAEPSPSATVSGGLAVVALAGATDAAWPLAQTLYADPELRPADIDETRARVLCGEPPSQTTASAREIKELGEMVAALKGDDAPSIAMLREIAHWIAVRALVVVHIEGSRAIARVFLPETGNFDAAIYAPDEASTPGGPANRGISWSLAVRSLDRSFGGNTAPPPLEHAPLLAVHEGPRIEGGPPGRKHFYESGWFWGALGAAAFAGGAIFLATRDTSPSTIHLEMQVPH